jgi:hypothetical protein
MATSLHPDIQNQLTKGRDLLAEVELTAEHLAHLMEEIHGRRWRVQIEHQDDVAFVMVAPRLDKRTSVPPVDKSNNGGN